MGTPKTPFSLYLIAFLLGGVLVYLYLERGNQKLRHELDEANKIRIETEDLVRKMTFRIDSLSIKEDSIYYVFKTVEKEVEVLTQVNGNLTLDALNLTDLDSIDVLSEEEYNYIRNELRNTYHK